jgi:hypothetical protein
MRSDPGANPWARSNASHVACQRRNFGRRGDLRQRNREVRGQRSTGSFDQPREKQVERSQAAHRQLGAERLDADSDAWRQ